jgi:hypothetical protein
MARRVHSGPFVGKRTFGLSRRATDQWCINNARIRMIGSGIPINQSRAPLPKPMTASMILTDRITQSVFEGSLQREPMSAFSTQEPERDFRGRRGRFFLGQEDSRRISCFVRNRLHDQIRASIGVKKAPPVACFWFSCVFRENRNWNIDARHRFRDNKSLPTDWLCARYCGSERNGPFYSHEILRPERTITQNGVRSDPRSLPLRQGLTLRLISCKATNLSPFVAGGICRSIRREG